MRSRTLRIALLALLLSLPAFAPAAADLQHPRQAFLRDAVAGLFLHWGLRTAPQHTDCARWEADVTNGGWDAGYWVREAEKLHAEYIVLATFHSRLGYARPYPSQIPGSCRTGRDFLGELIDAADARGLKVIHYMTDDPQWHREGLSSGSWLNSAAFSAYVGHSVDLSTRDGFGEFSYLQFFEQMRRYPKLAGFWIDNDNAYWERNNLYAKIYQQRPDMTLSNNNEDTAIMDMISNEQKTGMTPPYDYPQAVYTALPRLIEADFKLPTSGAWWYDGSDPGVDRMLTLGRLVSNAGSSVKALMAETAQVNGTFPTNQAAFNTFADGYLDAIWESLKGTEGGGYMHGGLKPGFWNDGAHGVTTISRTDPNLHYVHVLTRPTGGTLALRDNGYRITSVTDLRTGAPVTFSQGGGTLTLTGISSWDPYDTVFKVVSSGREGILSGVTTSAAAAGDGDYLTYWDAGTTQPVSLRFDLGSAKQVRYLAVNQREDSATHPVTQSARIRDYRVYVSDDGSTWGSPVKTGTLPNHRGVQIIDLPATTTRYVRLEKVNSHGVARLRVDEAWVGTSYPGSAPPPGRHEAEDGVIGQGVVESNHAGFSGRGFVNYDNVVGSSVGFQVSAAVAGQASLTFRYANGTTANRPMAVAVNGTALPVDFPGTGSWTAWREVSVSVPLNAGVNSVTATATTAGGGPNLDYLEVSGAAPPVSSYEGEAGVLGGAAVVSSCGACSGGSKVRFIGNGPANAVTLSVVSASAGARQVTVAGTVGGTRSFSVSVNGGTPVAVTLTGPDFNTPVSAVFTVSLQAGSNTLRFFNDTAYAPDLDRVTLG
ncbi:discoidin domain-containing protein [Nonomuraea sp. NPDC003804]|uniref:discoidin domain-containing protein n=1 Tax=Nonomuraea sp. NPDC003804 TaxID=3154547 RepID=UPI0033BBF741